MSWRKRGRIIDPACHGSWIVSHASVPCVLRLDEERWRVYFSGRDEENRSQTGFLDLALVDEEVPEILVLSDEPVLRPGAVGMFDDAGAMASCLVERDGDVYLYYIGWNRAVSVPFRNAVGLAVSTDGGLTFERVSSGPLLDRSIHDPGFTASTWVLIEDGIWRMWYLSCLGWEQTGEGLHHRYHIKYAESSDGVQWRRDGRVCIDFASDGEYAISRPCVIREPTGLYRMWYSHRGTRYRIGYAESQDGLSWERRDTERGLEPSATGWDSEMVEYPCVFDRENRRYLIYNGNGYGATGLGLAEALEPLPWGIPSTEARSS
jgi:hypothetical protein